MKYLNNLIDILYDNDIVLDELNELSRLNEDKLYNMDTIRILEDTFSKIKYAEFKLETDREICLKYIDLVINKIADLI